MSTNEIGPREKRSRLGLTRRHLLQWVTAASTGASARPGLTAQYLRMAGGLALGLGVCAVALTRNPGIWPVVVPFALLWLAAPAIAHRISLPERDRAALPLGQPEAQALRLIARRTWRYFETFVTETDSFLPPDNFQEIPAPTVFHRTSPTNIGLYLLSVTVARDMGWISQIAAVTRLEQTLATLARMPKFRGHLYNWHDTRDLQVLDPAYVSSVDSGNLAGHLIAVAQACRDWQDRPLDEPARRAGLSDALSLAQQAQTAELSPLLDRLQAAMARGDGFALLQPMASDAAAKAHAQDPDSDLAFWCGAARDCIAAHLEDTAAESAPDLARVEDRARPALDLDRLAEGSGPVATLAALAGRLEAGVPSEGDLGLIRRSVEALQQARRARVFTPLGRYDRFPEDLREEAVHRLRRQTFRLLEEALAQTPAASADASD